MHILRNILVLLALAVILCYAVEGNQDGSLTSRDFVTVQIQNGQIRGEIVETLWNMDFRVISGNIPILRSL